MNCFPVYFRHPRTGVVVEIDERGITTFFKLSHGHFRPFSEMRTLGLNDWGPQEEIAIYTAPHSKWQRVDDHNGGSSNA